MVAVFNYLRHNKTWLQSINWNVVTDLSQAWGFVSVFLMRCLDFILIQEAGTGRGRDGALAAFSGKWNIFVSDFPPLMRVRVPGGPWGSWAGPHCHGIPGIQGMPNAWLNQELNEFLWTKNKWSWVPAPAWSRGWAAQGNAQFPAHRLSPACCSGLGGEGESEFKGKCSIPLGFGSSRAAMGIPWPGLIKILETGQGAENSEKTLLMEGKSMHRQLGRAESWLRTHPGKHPEGQEPSASHWNTKQTSPWNSDQKSLHCTRDKWAHTASAGWGRDKPELCIHSKVKDYIWHRVCFLLIQMQKYSSSSSQLKRIKT